MSVTPDGIRHVVPCFVVYGVSPVIFFLFSLRISFFCCTFARKLRADEIIQAVAALQEAGHEVYDFRNPPTGDPGFQLRMSIKK